MVNDVVNGVARLPRRVEDVLVIGAGQAGLATSRWLTTFGIEHRVLEREKVGASWTSRRWDSFRLVTTTDMIRLPCGPPPAGEPGGFLGGRALAAHLESYAAGFGAPVETGVEVRALRRDSGAFVLETSQGERRAHAVVVAAGTFHAARRPEWAAHLSPRIRQIGALEYRNPDALPDGAVLVVGSGQSGVQIADELHAAGRTVHLAIGRTARLPRTHRGRDGMAWLRESGAFDRRVDEHPLGAAVRRSANAHVAPGATLDLRRLGAAGVRLAGRVAGGSGNHVVFADTLAESLDAADRGAARFQAEFDRHIAATGAVATAEREEPHHWAPGKAPRHLDLARERVGTVIWASGLAPDFSWIQLPVCDEHGWPRVRRGLTEFPGLAFVGLHWMHRWSSGLLLGVGRDAAHVTRSLLTPLGAGRRRAS